jgi:hypothetical protein
MVFWPKRDEVIEEWRRLHNEELYDLYSPDIARAIKSRIRLAKHVERGRRGEYSVVVGKHDRKTSLERRRRRWKIILQERQLRMVLH